MKYSDNQRIQKIYENAEKLQNYINEHGITSVIQGYSFSFIDGYEKTDYDIDTGENLKLKNFVKNT